VEVTRLQQRIAVEDDSQVGEARRIAASFARVAALGEPDAGRLAIVTTELATNLTKHADGGELIVRELREGSRTGVEVLSIDRGPGMDVSVALRDGHSTAGTRGEGLGAVHRLAQEFDAFSAPGGTVLMARVWKGDQQPAALQIGTVCLPLAGETESGDAWDSRSTVSVHRLLVVDGLGHGPIAARAARTAVEAFAGTDRMPGPEAIVHSLHGALRSTRGAALAVVELDLVSRQVRFCGVGNIAAMVEGAGERKARGLLSHNGIAGHEARRIQEFGLPWPGRGVLIVHSDGIQTQWKLAAYAGLQARHASVIAGILYRDFRRKGDDATVVVVKEP
jgi:anti-sigma regulatory factor (Ser/Thr protein kinase)